MEEVIFENIRCHPPARNIPERPPHKVQSERLHIDGDILSYMVNDEDKVGVYMGADSLTQDRNYFEIEILDGGLQSTIAIGLGPSWYPLDCQPGWKVDSIGYHADDGRLYKACGMGRPFGPKCFTGERMGCGIKFDQTDVSGVRPLVKVFFTKNGDEIGTVVVPWPHGGLFPIVGLHSEGEEVELHLDSHFRNDEVILMTVDNIDDDWSRLHQIRLNGSIMEYTGRGKKLIDVGLAQAKAPLDPTYHYFELEIIDPGENCSIAIGLAHRDYPKHRYPGWNAGSIAYHADDGKVFVGSGIGEPFGPECHKGDRMGCGITFPRDYTGNTDSRCSGSHEDVSDLADLSDSGSEDNDMWDKQSLETCIGVFFTRNGRTIGSREMKISREGLYPTIGMLSSDEKVKVDLRPLTG
ncbi:SPRY domain-containing protein 3-like isoform X1 [Argonauta hians]